MMELTSMARRSSSVWRWGRSVLLVVAVAIGLLGMHTLSTSHAQSVPVSASSADHHHDGAVVGTPWMEPACSDCGAGDEHDVLMMACVLALLAVICLLLRPRAPLMRVYAPVRGVETSLSRTSPLLMRPPSLLELSISRT